MALRMRLALVMLLLSTMPMAGAQSLSTGLVAWLPFDGDLQDRGPNGHHGSAIGAPAYVAGVRGSALDFDGVDDLLRVPGVPNATWDTAWTASWFMRADDLRRYSLLSKRSNCTVSQLIDVRLASTAPELVGFELSNGTQTAVARAPIAAGAWVHVAVVRDGGAARVVVDGVAGADVVAPSQDLAGVVAALAFGDSPCVGSADGTLRYAGSLDELRIYDRALAADEIVALANGGGVASSGGVTATPSEVTPGGSLKLAAVVGGLPDGSTCDARLGYAGPALGTVPLGGDGRAAGVVHLPATLQPGSAAIIALACGSPVSAQVVVGHDTVGVVAPIGVTVDDASGYAGQGITWSAEGVVGDSVELWFQGRRVAGPVMVVNGSASGVFAVPLPDPGAPPPRSGPLEARGLAGGVAASIGTTAFTQIADPGYRVRIAEVTLPPAAPPETALAISGRIEAADGRPSVRTLNLYFRDDGGRVVPLGRRDLVPGADGRFVFDFELPSLATLDGIVVRGPGELFLTYTAIDPVSGELTTYSESLGSFNPTGYAPMDDSAVVEVTVHRSNGGLIGAPLAGAYVQIGGTGADANADADADDGTADMLAVLARGRNQYRLSPDTVQTSSVCPIDVLSGYTDANGVFRGRLDANSTRRSFNLRADLARSVCQITEGQTCVRVTGVSTDVVVYTAHLGYGQVENGSAQPYRFRGEFRPSDISDGGRFYDPLSGAPLSDGNSPWQVQVLAPEITPALTVIPYRRRGAYDSPGGPGEQQPPLVPLDTVIEAGSVSYRPRPRAVFEIRADVKPCTNNPGPDEICVSGTAADGLEISYFHDVNVAGALESGYPRLVLCPDGTFNCEPTAGNVVPLVRDPNQPGGPAACGTGVQRWSAGYPTDRRNPGITRARGYLEVRSVYTPPGGGAPSVLGGRANIQVGLDPLPNWFTGYVPGPDVRPLTHRRIIRNPNGTVTLEGDEALSGPGGRSIDAASSQFSQYNLESPQRNRTRNSRRFSQTQLNAASNPTGLANAITSEQRIANNDGAPLEPDADALPPPTALRDQTLLDTGRIPLFRAAYGLPPIAAATLGMDFWLNIGVAYGGMLHADAMPPYLEFVTEPYSRFGVDVFLDASVILGLVSATVESSARSYLSNRSSFGAAGFDPTGYQCAGLNVDITLEICFLLCESTGQTLIGVYEARPDNPANYANCVGSTLGLPGFPLQAPPPGRMLPASGSPPRPQLRPRAEASIAYDREGRGAMTYLDAQNRLVRQRLPVCAVGTPGCAPRVVVSEGDRVTSTATAMLGPGGGVSVWAEVPGSPTTLEAATRAQRIRWARFLADGAQYAPQDLTLPGSGDGSVVVAACPALRTGCPAGGEVTAVWLRRIGASYEAHHYALMMARYTANGGWTTPVRVDPSQGAASDLQPTVAYRLGSATPVVAWVRMDTPGVLGLETRRIAYRFMDGASPVRIATGLGQGLSWPSLTARTVRDGNFDVEQLVLAYTVNVDTATVPGLARAFIGNTNALYIATCTPAGGGNCAFTGQELRDRFGRNLRVEKPNAVIDRTGGLVVTTRGLGFGPDLLGNANPRSSDPVGTQSGQGSVLMLRPKLDGSPVSIVDLDVDALGGFRVNTAYNQALDVFDTVSQPVDVGLGFVTAARAQHAPDVVGRGRARSMGMDTRLARVGAAADFRIERAAAAMTRVLPGGTVSVEVDVRNLGRGYTPQQAGDLELVATWNAATGAAVPALVQALPGLDSDQMLTRTLVVPVPGGIAVDEVQQLEIAVRSAPAAGDIDVDGNRRVLAFNGMPRAVNVRVGWEPGEPIVFLDWDSDAPDDPRVAGWRVLLVDEQGNRLPLGSTPVQGFADVSAAFGEVRQYVVLSYSARGVESAESEPVSGRPLRLRSPSAPFIFGDGFEQVE